MTSFSIEISKFSIGGGPFVSVSGGGPLRRVGKKKSSRDFSNFSIEISKICDFFIFVLEPREPFRMKAGMISSRSGPVAPLGMVWSPSYEGFCDFVVPVFCFSSKTHTSWLSFAF